MENKNQQNIIASIKNNQNPDQEISIIYLADKNHFVTSGIKEQLGMKDILIPAHLVATNIQLIGTIISAILEKISHAYEMDTTFDYISQFDVLDKTYTLIEEGEFVRLDVVLP